LESFSSPAMWAGLGNIILVNIVLSGDNAVVIAMAARGLPGNRQKQAVIWGSVAAIVMRVLLTIFAVKLLMYPYLKIVGGLLLFWIGIQLFSGRDGDGKQVAGHTALWAAIRTIVVADLVMSLDNVIGVAAAAKGNTTLLILGLAITIPLIIFGSTIMLTLMEKFPIIIALGAALLGYLAGDMMAADPAVASWFSTVLPNNDLQIVPDSFDLSITGLIGAAIVWAIGAMLAKRSAARSEADADKD